MLHNKIIYSLTNFMNDKYTGQGGKKFWAKNKLNYITITQTVVLPHAPEVHGFANERTTIINCDTKLFTLFSNKALTTLETWQKYYFVLPTGNNPDERLTESNYQERNYLHTAAEHSFNR